MTEPMFFCEHLPPPGELARLSEDESRHASHSRRLKIGDALWLFDGRGNVARARLQSGGGRSLEALIIDHRFEPAAQPTVHLACALPKGDRASVLLDMATQLGITSFTPLLCERRVVDPGEGTLERLRRVCLEACKQSRCVHLPRVLAPAKFVDAIARDGTKWIAHPDGKKLAGLSYPPEKPLTLFIGPEGGFTEEEVANALGDGAERVALGSTILRIEAAAVALVAAIMLR